MKKRLYLITTLLLSAVALTLSSCLKDSRFVDFSKAGTIVEFPFGGQVFFGQQAVTAAPDTDAKGTIILKFAVNVASPTVPKTATPITFDVDNPATVSAYNAAHPAVTYLPMPANAYVFTQNSITIRAGTRDTAMTVTFYKNLLDPSKSYMLPISIKSAGGYNISGNQGTMYYHFIGNDFAGSYLQDFTRYNAGDSTSAPVSGASFSAQPVTLSPVSPGQFEVATGYAGGVARYEVTFTKTGNGASAMYSNFAVSFNAADVTNFGTTFTLTQPPVFLVGSFYDPNKSYSYSDALKLFRFQAIISYGTHPRYIIDRYYKP